MKKALVCASLALGLLASSTSAFAYSSTGKSFTDSWTKYDSGTTWVIEYGFNDSAINEDFTHTKHDTKHHTAVVKNNNGSFADEDSAQSWAGIEVTHNGSTIYYYINY
ncbi:hypothetical protein SC499_24705 [Peribacillus simplex]|uniref:mediterrocin family bacteriocin n=1 Tax=Peribacillus simplex TaxID=1478 RepID=UPI00298E2074|nr:hypothetical protein [Peribacillus simplex]MDW7617785.1 hypothetical protein [Peribacillus simplex]